MVMEPVSLSELNQKILIPDEFFEKWLSQLDWTMKRIRENTFPLPFRNLAQLQLACLASNPLYWIQAFLRDPRDPQHKDPYNFYDYQVESLCYNGDVIHQDASEAGKTREIVPRQIYLAFNRPNGSSLIGAPESIHYDSVRYGILDQIRSYNTELANTLVRVVNKPHPVFHFSNGFIMYFRPSRNDGITYRNLHIQTEAVKEEAAKDVAVETWTEFWRAMLPGCKSRIYSVPNGDRSTEYYRLTQTAVKGQTAGIQFQDADTHIQSLKFRLFHWSKEMMPDPYWNAERKAKCIEMYGSESAPGYVHNVKGEHGDPEYSVFPWKTFRRCVFETPEYRCLKIINDIDKNEVQVTGLSALLNVSEGDISGGFEYLFDSIENSENFFGTGEIVKLLNDFLPPVEDGTLEGGADLGRTGDPSEILIWKVEGKLKRLLARIHLEFVFYDQQQHILDDIDSFYKDIVWGVDLGNAGRAVVDDLYGLDIYAKKGYQERLMGFQFGAATDSIDDNGEPMIDVKTGDPVRVSFKELATDFLVKRVQRCETIYPPDPDILLYYPNHTAVRRAGKTIFRDKDDHIIDAERVQELVHCYFNMIPDLFSSGSG